MGIRVVLVAGGSYGDWGPLGAYSSRRQAEQALRAAGWTRDEEKERWESPNKWWIADLQEVELDHPLLPNGWE